MFAITGITGQVGAAIARNLLAAGKNVRAVVRDAAKGAEWAAQGCELHMAEMHDAAALQRAFTGAEAVFILLPSNFDPSPGFPESKRLIAALRAALEAAQPGKVVCLSTVGAQAAEPNLLNQLQLLEQALGSLPMPVAFLRAAWFIENFAWDVAAVREEPVGVLPSFLQPLDRKVPMVATADIGRTAADMLQQQWQGKRIVELEGPQRLSPNDIAAGFARVLGKPVRAQAVPRGEWESLFLAQGMKNPAPRMRMLDGFNEGWIEFEAGPAWSCKGQVALDSVLRELVERG
jgi:NAD(P)H dehydrogenase (quinone)